jgi:hypothetical protein
MSCCTRIYSRRLYAFGTVRNSTTLHGVVDRDEAGAIDGTGAVGVSAGAAVVDVSPGVNVICVSAGPVGVSAGAVGISGDAGDVSVSAGAGVAGASCSNLCTSTLKSIFSIYLVKGPLTRPLKTYLPPNSERLYHLS